MKQKFHTVPLIDRTVHLSGSARKFGRRLLFASLATLILHAAALPAEQSLPSIFVAPLQGDPRLCPLQPAIGDGLAEMLITEITKIGKFRVLESTTLDSIKEEIKMGDDGWIAQDEKVAKGNWKGADYMLVGKITRFGGKHQSFGGSGGWGPIRFPGIPGVGGFDVTKTEAEVQIDWRIVDTSSREIVKSGRGSGKEKGTSWGFGGSMGSGFVHEQEFLGSALGKATMKALDEIVSGLTQVNLGAGTRTKLAQSQAEETQARRKADEDSLRMAPGEVKAVTAQFIVVSLGSKQGLKPGDRLELYELNEVRNKKGEVVMSDEKLVGAARVESTQAETSKARCEGNLTPEEGWVARISPASSITTASLKN